MIAPGLGLRAQALEEPWPQQSEGVPGRPLPLHCAVSHPHPGLPHLLQNRGALFARHPQVIYLAII